MFRSTDSRADAYRRINGAQTGMPGIWFKFILIHWFVERDRRWALRYLATSPHLLFAGHSVHCRILELSNARVARQYRNRHWSPMLELLVSRH